MECLKSFENIYTIPFDTYSPKNITLLFPEKKTRFNKVKY